MNEVSLSCLRQGDRGVLTSVDLDGGMRRRLRDLGLVPGTGVTCAYIAPAGSPMAFWIRGALIALRREDCAMIHVRRCA